MTMTMTMSLFDTAEYDQDHGWRQELCDGAVVLRRFALPDETAILAALHDIVARTPFRHMVTPGGFRMSVAMTNCGSYGWVTDTTGYRYDSRDPQSGNPWPGMPAAFLELAHTAAARAGFSDFVPDACLINRYTPGARLSLHQDKNEQDLSAPIVSVSLGIPACFLFGGYQREDKPLRVRLTHGDVVVWGGPARLRYHGIMPLKDGHHPLLDGHRINLTFRKAA
ncbi:MAG: alpha-ketoglutarate-dependent dioxygenase AlkB [Herminiimonas sp.]|nr:alpha-ketoglutarate-dependent dioxygenase AlkB [Herminiimonas sp.]